MFVLRHLSSCNWRRLLEKNETRLKKQKRKASWNQGPCEEGVLGQEERREAWNILKESNGVVVDWLPQPAWRYVGRVAARNPGNVECSNLDHNMDKGEEDRVEKAAGARREKWESN